MHNGSRSEPRGFAQPQTQRGGPSEEAAEVAALLMRAGVDHASALWFQLMELATQRACDWIERSAAAQARLSPRDAAALGLRSLAIEILSAAPGQAEGAGEAAEACLDTCAEVEIPSTRLPPRRRRWGEGALPSPPQRQGLLASRAGCC